MPGAISDCSDSSDLRAAPPDPPTGTIERRSNSERKRNLKKTSFKSLIESRIFSKSDKELQQVGLDEERKVVAVDATSTISQEDTEVRRHSSCHSNTNDIIFRLFHQEHTLGNTLQHDKKILSRSASVISTKTVTNLVKGKSMPSLW